MKKADQSLTFNAKPNTMNNETKLKNFKLFALLFEKINENLMRLNFFVILHLH